MTGFLMWALWSLNERAAGREGIDLPQPSGAYLGDLVAALEMDRAALENQNRG